jgi:hypothetical protein
VDAAAQIEPLADDPLAKAARGLGSVAARVGNLGHERGQAIEVRVERAVELDVASVNSDGCLRLNTLS